MLDDLVRFLHLVAASIWVGGLITLGALAMAVRRAGADRTVLQAMARQFGRLSWTAMGVAVVTGVIRLARSEVSLSSDTGYAVALFIKLSLVGLAAALALIHQMTARTTSPATRGALQGLILATSLGIVGAAVAL
jgi:putative copper export protein